MVTERYRALTDAQWKDGWEELKANLPGQEMTPEQALRRGNSYRRELGHLTNEQWIHAVSTALRVSRWFPPIAELLEYAREIAPPVSGLLPAARKPETPAEVEQWRAGIQAGMDQIRAEMASRGMPLDQVVHSIPMPGKRPRKRRKS